MTAAELCKVCGERIVVDMIGSRLMRRRLRVALDVKRMQVTGALYGPKLGGQMLAFGMAHLTDRLGRQDEFYVRQSGQEWALWMGSTSFAITAQEVTKLENAFALHGLRKMLNEEP